MKCHIPEEIKAGSAGWKRHKTICMMHYRQVKKKALRTVANLALLGSLAVLTGCFGKEFAKHEVPLNQELINRMADLGVDQRDEIFIRIFKREAELEVWKKLPSGKNILLKAYEICAWAGDLGPKFREGDRQAPEGFYKVTPALMNPNSSFHLSFNLGFPNPYDRAHGRTGSFLMVHGACSSAGCYSMEDHQIEEIYALAREAFVGGQKAFQVHAFPFRMTPKNMALFADDKHMPFWRMLKRGYEHFELTGVVPKVDACDRRYVFNVKPEEGETFVADEACPAYEVPKNLEEAVKKKIEIDLAAEKQIASKWASADERKFYELNERLRIEKARVQKFRDRELGYSRHQGRRISALEKQLLALNFTPPPVVEPLEPEKTSGLSLKDRLLSFSAE